MYVTGDISCRDCGSSWTGQDGRIHCGGSPDWDKKPLWAERKYSLEGLLKLSQGITEGMDCENVDPRDALKCKAYKERS